MVFIYAMPLEAMKGEIAIGSLAASNLFGPSVAGVFSALMAVCIISTVNAEITIGPRVYYAMAKNRAFFSAAATVHPRWHTPIVAIVAQGLCAMAMTVTPFPQLVIYIGMSLTLFTVLSVASLFVFRRRRAGWQRLRAVTSPGRCAGVVHPGGRGDDGVRRGIEPGAVAGGVRDGRGRCAGVPVRNPGKA